MRLCMRIGACMLGFCCLGARLYTVYRLSSCCLSTPVTHRKAILRRRTNKGLFRAQGDDSRGCAGSVHPLPVAGGAPVRLRHLAGIRHGRPVGRRRRDAGARIAIPRHLSRVMTPDSRCTPLAKLDVHDAKLLYERGKLQALQDGWPLHALPGSIQHSGSSRLSCALSDGWLMVICRATMARLRQAPAPARPAST